MLITPGPICINNICVEEMHLLKGIVAESAGETAHRVPSSLISPGGKPSHKPIKSSAACRREPCALFSAHTNVRL